MFHAYSANVSANRHVSATRFCVWGAVYVHSVWMSEVEQIKQRRILTEGSLLREIYILTVEYCVHSAFGAAIKTRVCHPLRPWAVDADLVARRRSEGFKHDSREHLRAIATSFT
jgi:hypothetical protein